MADERTLVFTVADHDRQCKMSGADMAGIGYDAILHADSYE